MKTDQQEASQRITIPTSIFVLIAEFYSLSLSTIETLAAFTTIEDALEFGECYINKAENVIIAREEKSETIFDKKDWVSFSKEEMQLDLAKTLSKLEIIEIPLNPEFSDDMFKKLSIVRGMKIMDF